MRVIDFHTHLDDRWFDQPGRVQPQMMLHAQGNVRVDNRFAAHVRKDNGLMADNSRKGKMIQLLIRARP